MTGSSRDCYSLIHVLQVECLVCCEEKHAISLWIRNKPWPLLVSQQLSFSKKKSKTQKGACFDPLNNGYEILESGGTNIGGEDCGAANHEVIINENKCSYGKPTIYHRPCSHMITAC